MIGEEISTDEPIHINCSESLAVMATFNKSSLLSNPFKHVMSGHNTGETHNLD